MYLDSSKLTVGLEVVLGGAHELDGDELEAMDRDKNR